MNTKVIAAVIAIGALAVPATASADVLINDPGPYRKVCGDAIKVGVWTQPGTTTGSRVVTITARDARKRVWWRKTVKAPFRDWRYWDLPSGRNGRCGTTYITYSLPHGWRQTYRITFRSEGV
jgi:hypothetical protein